MKNNQDQIIDFNSDQESVLRYLGRVSSPENSFDKWYLGALYAVKNRRNPDRFSQAAQSLRELLEKLARLFPNGSSNTYDSQCKKPPDFEDMRKKMYAQLISYKKACNENWEENINVPKLKNVLNDVEQYLELSTNRTTRLEKLEILNRSEDPLYNVLSENLKKEKIEKLRFVWYSLQEFAHHKSNCYDEKLFNEIFERFDEIILQLFNLKIASEQNEICEILKKSCPHENEIDRIFELIGNCGANFVLFFNKVQSHIWLEPLFDKGFFDVLESEKSTCFDNLGGDYYELPLLYLGRIVNQKPERVVEIIESKYKNIKNPNILRGIFLIVRDLENLDLSARLCSYVMEYLKLPSCKFDSELIIDILNKWDTEDGKFEKLVHKIVKYVLAFQEDPEREKKIKSSKEHQQYCGLLNPAPRYNDYDYNQILEKGIRPLIRREPHKIAKILTGASTNMLKLRFPAKNHDKKDSKDLSEIWFRRLNDEITNSDDSKIALVKTLIFACKQVYESVPDHIEEIDKLLKKQYWKLFERICQYLYAQFPIQKNLPWIREMILEHQDYHKLRYRYEFQIMIRKSCKHFDSDLLSEEEQKMIFDFILSGPSKEVLREFLENEYTEADFLSYQKKFHFTQLRPFAQLLKGEILYYYNGLKIEFQADALSDDSYLPYGGVKCGYVSYRSPKTTDELASFTDEELLNFINDWDDKTWDRNNHFIEISISALAKVFQSLIREKIMVDSQRFGFWLANKDRIVRPIYITAILNAMQDFIKDNSLDKLGQIFGFCDWVISNPSTFHDDGKPMPNVESRENPDWNFSRLTAVSLVETCLSDEINLPIWAREKISDFLRQVINQPDWRLDRNKPMIQNHDDPVTEAYNAARSRALVALGYFGRWVKKRLPDDKLEDYFDILEKRFGKDAEYPLTRPEYAILGIYFGNAVIFNSDWANQKRNIMIPRDNDDLWSIFFSNYIRFNQPSRQVYAVLQDDYKYAIDNFVTFIKDMDDSELIFKFFLHIISFYLWEIYPLKGENSLLERFYSKTDKNRQLWAQLFSKVGRIMFFDGNKLEKNMNERIIDYFDYRYEHKEPTEFRDYHYWLEADFLDSGWRLQSYLKILTLKHRAGARIDYEIKALEKMLDKNTALVIECFVKVTEIFDSIPRIYSVVDEVKSILEVGINSTEPEISYNAKLAQNNLLKMGYEMFLEL